MNFEFNAVIFRFDEGDGKWLKKLFFLHNIVSV